MTPAEPRALLGIWPRLERGAGFAAVGDFPTPVDCWGELAAGAPQFCRDWRDTYVKRDDQSSALYGGNKVRTLEPLLWQAQHEEKRWVYSTGAYGSNHAVATVLHGERLGFRTGVMLFPQPFSGAAAENLRLSSARAEHVVDLLHWSTLPLSMWRRRLDRRSGSAYVMPPGGATPRGALGFLSAGLELGLQVAAGELPPPAEIIIGLGSTCSTAGLLVGLSVAARLGIGFPQRSPPLLVAVRVTPWPVTSRVRILSFSLRVARWLRELTQDAVFELPPATLAASLSVEGRYLGAGYGKPTAAGIAAMQRLARLPFALDTTYSAKSAAALLDRVRAAPGVPRLFWATKSSAALPETSAEQLARAPSRMQRWLASCERASAR